MRTRTVIALACSLLAVACAHRKKEPAVDSAIEVHGRIIPDGEPVGGAPRTSTLARWWAAVPMSGRCDLSDCLGTGWRTATPDGPAVTQCEPGGCGREGWTTRHPDGSASRTRCSFRSCLTDGWTTRNDDGTTVEVRCAFGKCLEDGWKAIGSDGRTAVAKCLFGDCAKEGWTLAVDGQAERLTCRCEFSDCARNGASCR